MHVSAEYFIPMAIVDSEGDYLICRASSTCGTSYIADYQPVYFGRVDSLLEICRSILIVN